MPRSKSTLSEQDLRTKLITPAIGRAGWDLDVQLRAEVSLTHGRIIVRGEIVARGKPQRADDVLYHRPHLPIAVVEAKDLGHSVDHILASPDAGGEGDDSVSPEPGDGVGGGRAKCDLDDVPVTIVS